MTFKHKTAAGIGIGVALLIAILYVSSSTLFLRGFQAEEQELGRINVMRVLESIKYDMNGLAGEADDWAAWDDSYDFIATGRQDFIRSNLTAAAFKDLRLNFIAYTDLQGKLIYSKAMSSTTGKELVLSPGFFSDLVTLFEKQKSRAHVAGMVVADNQPTVVTISPVIDSSRKKPPRGYLVMGRFLDAAASSRIAQLTQLQITLSTSADSVPPAVSRALVEGKESIIVLPLDHRRARGYAMIAGLDGKPAVYLVEEHSRKFYTHGKELVYSFVFVMLCIASLMGYAAWWGLNRIVAARDRQSEVELRHYSMLEQLTDGVAIIDPANLHPVEMNKAYLQLLAVTAETARQRPLFDYVVECGSLKEKIPLITEHGKRLKGECIFEAANGLQVTAEISLSLMKHAGQPHICLVVHDITERRLAEDELEAHRQHLELLVADRTDELTLVNQQLRVDNARIRRAEAALTYRFDFEQLIASISTRFITLPVEEMDAGMNEALQLVGEFAEVDRSYIYRFNSDKKTMSKQYEWCRQGIEPSIHRLGSVPVNGFSWFFKHMMERKPIRISSLNEIPVDENILIDELNRQNILAMLCIPMVLGDEVIGFVGFNVVHDERVWSDDVVSLLKMVGDIFANAFGRRHVEEALTESERLMRTLIEEIPDGIVYKDGNGKWLLVNQTVRAGMQITDDSWYGRSDDEIVELVPDSREFVLMNASTDKEAWESRDVVRNEVVINFGVNRAQIVEMAKVPLFDADGARQGLISISRDISKHKEAEITLKEARDLALHSAEVKTNFLANMSHEIRTPMNGILGMLDLTLHSELNEKQREFLTLAKSSADSLLVLINDILDFSKIEAGKLDIERVPFSLAEVVNDSLGSGRFAAQQKHILLDTSFAAGIPDRLLGDPHRLRQILINLVGNAVKFTENGGVTVAVSGKAVSESKIIIELMVKDTGIGIPTERQEHIFESFTQGDGSITRKYGGTGLGLAIVQQLATMMGGAASVNSTPEVGSEFYVNLPFTIAKDNLIETGEVKMPASATTTTDLRGLSILLAEDNRVNQRVVEGLLAEEGCQVHIVSNGQQAVLAAAEAPFDLILMDVQMPVMDGFEATRHLRENGVRIPIVALTAHALNGDRERCLAAGMDDYLSKPITGENLFALLARLVATGKVRAPKKPASKKKRNKAGTSLTIVKSSDKETAALAESPSIPAVFTTSAPLFDSERALDQLQGNRELLQEVVTIFLAEGPSLLRQLRDAFDRSHVEDIRRCAHSLKGMFAHIGVQALADDCYKIQYGADDTDVAELFDAFCHVEQNFPALERELRSFVHVRASAPLVPGKARFLVVEDDFMTRHLLKKLLAEHGSIDIAIDGNEAILAFQSALEADQPYDLICMDIQMKQLDGQEALTRIRSLETDMGIKGANEVKVIMVTAVDDPKSVVQAMYRGGAISYITKPIDAGKLVEELKEMGLVKAA